MRSIRKSIWYTKITTGILFKYYFTSIRYRLNWVDRGPVDEQRRPGQLVLASRRRTPQNFRLSELS